MSVQDLEIKRDYAIQAFRLYAENGADINTDDFLLWLDCQAVSMMLSVLHDEGKTSVIDALKFVYFYKPAEKLRKNDIEYRVLRFASEKYVDRVTVYRWLSYGVRLFMAVRFHDKKTP